MSDALSYICFLYFTYSSGFKEEIDATRVKDGRKLGELSSESKFARRADFGGFRVLLVTLLLSYILTK